MEKAGTRTRDIQFWSEKNQQMVCVHSRRARDFARWLEGQPWVKTYQTCVPLEQDKLPRVNPVDIRKEYLNTKWTTDFLIHTADGRTAVREFVDAGDFTKKARAKRKSTVTALSLPHPKPSQFRSQFCPFPSSVESKH